ncbi:hypothetical protein AB0K60_15590, partial [Thermopolyspora sp. NPDC052614]|uniref:hypothetical protein n=1 Tax=Thermopolyspora sp. NPDC052614 TaxID=3155682 RepID=UPI003449FBD7
MTRKSGALNNAWVGGLVAGAVVVLLGGWAALRQHDLMLRAGRAVQAAESRPTTTPMTRKSGALNNAWVGGLVAGAVVVLLGGWAA